MANDYYGPQEVAVPGTTVRSQQFNNNNGGIEAGFDKLPTPVNTQTAAHRYAVDTGAVENAYEITLDFKSQVTDYVEGMEVSFLAAKQNTGPATLSVNGLAPKLLVTSDNFQLTAGSIVTDTLISAQYDGTSFRVINVVFRDVKFDTTEEQTLSANQTTVTFSVVSTTGTSYYVEGQLVDRGRLLLGEDYTITNTNTIELLRFYPAGTKILAAQNEANTNDNLSENIYESVFNRRISQVIIGASYKQYEDDGRDLTPRLLYSGNQFTPLETPPAPADPAWTFTGAVVDNGDGTIDVPTSDGVKVFNKVNAEAVGRSEVVSGDSIVSGGGIWPDNGNDSAKVGDIGLSGVVFLSNGTDLYRCKPSPVSGDITAIDFTAGTATIGGVSVSIKVTREDTLQDFESAIAYTGSARKIKTLYHTQEGIGGDEYVLTGATGTPNENLYDGGKFNDPLGREWASTSYVVRPSRFGVLPSTTSGTDYTTQMQKCINYIPDGRVFESDVETTVGATVGLDVNGKTNVTFRGNKVIALADNSVAPNSRGIFTFENCVGCDFELYGNGNNQNNTNDTNGTTGLVAWCRFLNCKDCNMKDGRVINANNESYYLAEGCVDCAIFNNTSQDAFGTDFKLGGSTTKKCHIYNNRAIVTRDIHSEKGSGATGKQDGFVAIRFGVEDCTVYNNVGDNTDDSGVNFGVLAYCLWATGMKGSFKSYGNKWTGGDAGDYFNLDNNTDLDLLVINDTVSNSGSCLTLLTVGAAVANIKSLDINCEFYGQANPASTAVELLSNSGQLTVVTGSLRLNSTGTKGAYAINNQVGNMEIHGTIDHTQGTSHAILLNGGNDNIVSARIEMGGQAARSIEILDSSNNLINSCRTRGDAAESIKEQGTSNFNVFTNNITSKAITSIGAGSYVDPNSNLIRA